MLFPQKKLDEIVKEIKSFGNFLIPYNYPKAPLENENDIAYLKLREITIDGYDLIIYYSKSEWPEYQYELLQITGKYFPFLPFTLICKIGKKFLGENHLSYIDFIEYNRKTYCWVLLSDKKNNAIAGQDVKEARVCTYDGLSFKRSDHTFEKNF